MVRQPSQVIIQIIFGGQGSPNKFKKWKIFWKVSLGSSEECEHPNELRKWKNFWTCWCGENSGRYAVKFWAQILYIVFQHKLHFNPVQDLFKQIEDQSRSFNIQIDSDIERVVTYLV